MTTAFCAAFALGVAVLALSAGAQAPDRLIHGVSGIRPTNPGDGKKEAPHRGAKRTVKAVGDYPGGHGRLP